MFPLVFIVSAWFALYAVMVGRLDSALYLSGIALAAFVLGAPARR